MSTQIKPLIPPTFEPITLAEARMQCRVDTTDEDALLTVYIGAARAMLEHECGRRFALQTWRQTLDEFPSTGDIEMKVMGPANSVSQIQYVDAAGTLTTLSASAYVLDADTPPAGWVLTADGVDWPSTKEVANAVRLDIVCGNCTTIADVPEDVRAWMLLAVCAMFDKRSSDLPRGFGAALLDAHRAYAL